MVPPPVVGRFYRAGARGPPPARVGLAMSVGPLVTAAAGVPAGRLSDPPGPPPGGPPRPPPAAVRAGPPPPPPPTPRRAGARPPHPGRPRRLPPLPTPDTTP